MIQDKMPSSKLFNGASSVMVKNAPAVAVLGAIIFFIVAHPFVFDFVDSVVEKVFGTNTQRDLLVFIHALVFGGLIFGGVYLGDYLKVFN